MSEPTHGQSMGRRAFLRAAARTSLAGGLAGGCALLVLKPARGDCVKIVSCGNCGSFDGCALPKAQLARDRGGAEGIPHA